MATGSNSEPKEGSPSFFKVIRHPSAPHLALPNAFVKTYMKKIPKNPTIVTATGGLSWSLKFVKIGEEYCFAHGWENLAKDVELCSRDIVIFWLIDPLTFVVKFLGANGCEKDLPTLKTTDDGVKDDGDNVGKCHEDDDDGGDNGVMAEENLCFQKVYSRKTNKYHMSLPVKFVKAAGLEHKESIQLRDREGNEWTMGINAERYARTKYSISKGWARFSRYHKFADGDVCTFTFNKKEGVMNLTQVFKSKTPIKQETDPMEEDNRNKGRRGENVRIEDDWLPIEKPCDRGSLGGGCGGLKVKVEYESGSEMEAVKRKRGKTLVKSFADVKIEDGSDAEMAVGERERGMPPVVKPSGGGGGGVEVKTDGGRESVFRSKHVVYF